MNKDGSAFERVYDTYSSQLYGIALEIAPSVATAESLLMKTFEESSN